MRSPMATSSLSLAKPALAFLEVTQAAMFFMSASLNWAAMGCMIGLARLPDLNSCSCLTRYSGCCCASLGLAGVPELPSAAWQAAQTAVNLASPAARSGLATAGAAGAAAAPCSPAAAGFSSAADADRQVAAREAASSREARSFISEFGLLAQNLMILQ